MSQHIVLHGRLIDFFNWAETNKNVIRWCSECVKIPYAWPDGSIHQYYTDAYVEMLTNDGTIQKFLVEIKPVGKGPVKDKNGVIHTPKPPKRKTAKAMKNYINEMQNYQKNVNKWKAAQAFCQKKGWKFIVLTTQDFIK